MARTPLFHALRQALRNALHTDEERAQRSSAPQISRRQVLKGGVALAGVGLLARVDAQRVSTRDKVAVVGAGTAGLVAAYRLKQAGVLADVYEASSRVGGRMFSGYGLFGPGQVIEWGGELVDSGHTRLRSLATGLGLTLIDLKAFEMGKKLEPERWRFGGQTFSAAQLEAAFAPLVPALREASKSLGDDVTYRAFTPGAKFLDQLSIAEWLERVGAPQPIRGMLELAYTTEFGLESGEQSVLNLLTLIGEDSPFAVYGDSDEQYRIREGSGAVPQRLAQLVGAQIQTGKALTALEQTSSGYTLSFADGSSARFEHVVLALPFSLLREVDLRATLPPAKLRAIERLGYGTNAKLFFGFGARIWETRHFSSASTYTDEGYQTSWDTTRGQPGTGGVIVNFVGGQHGLETGSGTPASQAAGFLEGFEKLYPGARAAYSGAAQRYFWPNKPWVKGSYQCYLPGQYTGFRGAEGERVGRLYFCGEHTSLEAAGYMEGAVETGERVAREVLALVRRG